MPNAIRTYTYIRSDTISNFISLYTDFAIVKYLMPGKKEFFCLIIHFDKKWRKSWGPLDHASTSSIKPNIREKNSSWDLVGCVDEAKPKNYCIFLSTTLETPTEH